MTQEALQERIDAYSRRYKVSTRGPMGLPPYPAGERETPQHRDWMVLYKAMCDLLWTLWGIIQHVNHNPADDFWAYAVNRFERCKKLMGASEFGGHLQAVRDG